LPSDFKFQNVINIGSRKEVGTENRRRNRRE